MSPAAIAMVLGSAAIHATWNLLTKKAGGGVSFLWLFALVSVGAYGPYVAWLALSGQLPLQGRDGIALLVSSGFHLGYILLLQRAYAVADLSVVYPIARGTGPLLTSAAAIFLLSEEPTALGIAGIGAICGGVFLMAGPTRSPAQPDRRAGMALALATGIFIAGYTLADKYAVDQLEVHPVMVIWFEVLVRAIVLTPLSRSARAAARAVTNNHWRAAVAVGLLGPLGYALVLFAFRLAPASYVAPMRESAIAIGAMFGMVLLKEPRTWRRFVAVGTIVSGVVLIGIA